MKNDAAVHQRFLAVQQYSIDLREILDKGNGLNLVFYCGRFARARQANICEHALQLSSLTVLHARHER